MIKFLRRLAAALLWLVLTPVVLLIAVVAALAAAFNEVCWLSFGAEPLDEVVDTLGVCIYALRILVDRAAGLPR